MSTQFNLGFLVSGIWQNRWNPFLDEINLGFEKTLAFVTKITLRFQLREKCHTKRRRRRRRRLSDANLRLLKVYTAFTPTAPIRISNAYKINTNQTQTKLIYVICGTSRLLLRYFFKKYNLNGKITRKRNAQSF